MNRPNTPARHSRRDRQTLVIHASTPRSISRPRSVLAVCALAASAPAQTLVCTVTGPAANAMFGKVCIEISDQNGDGRRDLLVGAPGFSSQRGAIYCVSGASLASGSGAQVLWSLAPTANQGDLFGYALAEVPDVTGDGVDDFLVGQPGYDITGSSDVGAVRLVHGISHAVLSARTGTQQGMAYGSALANFGSFFVAVGAPAPLGTQSAVFLNGCATFTTSGVASTSYVFTGTGSDQLGTSLACADVDGNGVRDVVAGMPGHDNGAGGLEIFYQHSTGGGVGWIATYEPGVAGERLGESLDARHDYDGDGVIDVVAGAPNFVDAAGNQIGRAVVISVPRLLAHTAPYEIHTLSTTAGSLLGASHYHFGAAVRASGDLNGDGVGEILVGAPDYFTLSPLPTNHGFADIYSGTSGARLARIVGASKEHLGDSLTGAFGDLDGDGFEEFVLAGAFADANGADSGAVKCYRLFPIQPSTYCTGKLNSLGCTPAISFSGSPNANPIASFAITATGFVNQKNGLLFYSHQPTAAPFQGGTKCVANPTMRTPVQNSGGSPSGNDCTGTFSFDFNALIAGGTDASLVAGAEVYAQYWSRDPQSPSTTSLSNALRFVVNP